MTLYILS